MALSLVFLVLALAAGAVSAAEPQEGIGANYWEASGSNLSNDNVDKFESSRRLLVNRQEIAGQTVETRRLTSTPYACRAVINNDRRRYNAQYVVSCGPGQTCESNFADCGCADSVSASGHWSAIWVKDEDDWNDWHRVYPGPLPGDLDDDSEGLVRLCCVRNDSLVSVMCY